MRISRVHIHNFRKFTELEVDDGNTGIPACGNSNTGILACAGNTGIPACDAIKSEQTIGTDTDKNVCATNVCVTKLTDKNVCATLDRAGGFSLA